MLLCCLWRNVEDSCHTLRRRLPSKTNSAAHQRLVSSTRWSVAAKYALTARHGASYWLRIAISPYPTCIRRLHSTPPAFPSEYCHPVWYGKTTMTWLPDGRKIVKICLFVLTQFTNATDTRTHTQTDRHRMTA